MQLGCATFVQPNLSFSTKSNYSIMMETMEILFKQTGTSYAGTAVVSYFNSWSSWVVKS